MITGTRLFPATKSVTASATAARLFAVAVLTLAGACRPAARSETGGPVARSSASGSAVAAADLLARQLLDADRASARDAASRRFPEALGAMFTDDVRMPVRDRIVSGRQAVLAVFSTSPDTGATVRWTPVRVGLAADGQHGFTAGVQQLTRTDGTRVAARYLAYWVRSDAGRWMVAAWRRRPLNGAAPDTTMLPALLPPAGISTDHTPTAIRGHYRGLVAAEQGFSDEASRSGLGAAFARLGDSEAINMGRGDEPTFVRGPAAIAQLVAGGQPLDAPSVITWNADTALVAASGDLGITFGVIRPKQVPANAPPGAPAGSAFFTIWRKASPTAPWRYVAE